MKTSSKVFLIIGIVIVIAAVLYGVYNIYGILHSYSEGEQPYDEVEEKYVVRTDADKDPELTQDELDAILQEQSQTKQDINRTETDTARDGSGISQLLNGEDPPGVPRIKYVKPKFVFDYMSLHRAYPDVVGYIYQEEYISYPILKGKTNDTYLRTMINGQYNICGSIFLDSSMSLRDGYAVIYGHNVKNGQMFGSLLLYKDEEYLKTHPYFDIYDGMLHYRYYVFAVCRSEIDSQVFTYGLGISKEPEPELKDFAEKIKEESIYEIPDRGMGPFTNDDHIICLSTCTANLDYNYRQTVFLRRAFRYSR